MKKSKELDIFRGATLVPYGEIDYEGLSQAHCNSADTEICEEVDCKDCLFDKSNLELFKGYIKRMRTERKRLIEKIKNLKK